MQKLDKAEEHKKTKFIYEYFEVSPVSHCLDLNGTSGDAKCKH
jgi:hypothetical protein